MNLTLDELRAWLRLILTPRLGLSSARKLLAALGSPQAVFDAGAAAWAELLPSRECKGLATEPEGLHEHTERTWAWLHEADPSGAGRAILSLADARYPQALLQADDPPLLLFALGRLSLLQAPAVAIVGSRHLTEQGRENAHAFARALSEAGLTVVSGLADGIDGAAHEGALDGLPPDGDVPVGRGSTIAVVGTGLDRVYPRKHHELAHRIARQGLMLSECLLGTPPLAANFPRRNRIVAALARGTLVVEAAVQSGSLITARLAAEMGREVFAIPGSIHAPQSRGCHALIKQGAKLVETAQDVMDELHWGRAALTVQGSGSGACSREANADAHDAACTAEDADPLLAAMAYDPVGLDALAARTGLSPADLGVRLLQLELEGRVARLPGQLFQRLGQA